MDSKRFDAMARALSTPTYRRRALKTLATGIAATLIAARHPRAASAGPERGRRPGRCGPIGQPCKFHEHCCQPYVCFGGYCAASTAPPPPPGCTSPADCPSSSNPCLEATCGGGQCGFANVDGGTLSCGVGACQRTVPECLDGVLQECVPGQPSPEACNGLDDDCDGEVDNGFPVGQPCDGSDADTFEEGFYVCGPNGGVICSDTTG